MVKFRKMLKKALRFGFGLVKERPRGWLNLILNQTAAMVKSPYVPALPVHITIEPTNVCDQKCPVCETGAGVLGRPPGFMSLENFKQIIDKIYTHTNTLMFYFMGEPFLNKDAYEMIKYAKSKGIFIEACTNGNFIDGRRLIESGIDKVAFQIGGATQKTHGIYRCNGNLEKILENVRTAVAAKKEMGAKTEIVLGFIVMRHNEHEVDAFRELVQNSGVDRGEIVNPCVRDYEQGKMFLTKDEKYWIYDRVVFEKGVLRPKFPMDKNSCWWIWHSAVITWDGNVVPCCRDPKGEFMMGNVLQDDLRTIWNGEKYRNFRKAVLANQKNVPICGLCTGFGLPHLK